MESLVAGKVLLSLGLSEYEARAYVSLIMEGTCEARKLSMKCGVPRTKIYATLSKLNERGLVFELPGEPRKFAPASPDKAFNQYLLHLREEVSNRVVSLVKSRELVSSLEEEYEEMESTIEPRKEDVWIIRGSSQIVEKIEEALSQAGRNVTLITTGENFIFFCKALGKKVDDLVEKGVNVRIGTKINSRNKSLAREFNYICEVRDVDFPSPLLYLCVDERTCLLAEFSLSNPNVYGVFFNNPTLSTLFSLMLPRMR